MLREGFLLGCLMIVVATGQPKTSPETVPGSYIFYFDRSHMPKDSIHATSIDGFLGHETSKMLENSATGFKPFSVGAVKGFTLRDVDDDQLEKLSARAAQLGISYHENYVMKLNIPKRGGPITRNESTPPMNRKLSTSLCTQRSLVFMDSTGVKTRLHHLDWLDLALGDPTYCSPAQQTQAGRMDVFVFDTGVDNTHPDLSHISITLDECDDGTNAPWTPFTDKDGHGTHVSGIIASKTSGVTPNVNLHLIKILNDEGRGDLTALLCALDKLQTWLDANPSRKAVINMSVGPTTGIYSAGDAAISSLINSYSNRVAFAIASGNDAVSSCTASYSTARDTVSVGSVSVALVESDFSNYGACIDVMASGEDILSTVPGGYELMSGTSMASPLVAGVITQYWLDHPTLTGVDIRSMFDKSSSDLDVSGRLQGLKTGTPNKMIKYTCLGGCPVACAPVCQNGGACLTDGTCSCIPGYIGTVCDTPTICASQPCQHGGSCVLAGAKFTCACQSGSTGTLCEQMDYCVATPCLNGGTCDSTASERRCTCQAGFNGNRCEKDVNECASQPCLNGGTCVDKANAFQCKCRIGFIGSVCGWNATCLSSPCQNNATCLEAGPSNFTCACPEAFSGAHCETKAPCLKPLWGYCSSQALLPNVILVVVSLLTIVFNMEE